MALSTYHRHCTVAYRKAVCGLAQAVNLRRTYWPANMGRQYYLSTMAHGNLYGYTYKCTYLLCLNGEPQGGNHNSCRQNELFLKGCKYVGPSTDSTALRLITASTTHDLLRNQKCSIGEISRQDMNWKQLLEEGNIKRHPITAKLHSRYTNTIVT